MRYFVGTALVLALFAFPALAAPEKLDKLGQAGADDDAAIVANLKEKLKTKVTVDFKEARLVEAMEMLGGMVDDLKIWLDTVGGVSRNQTISYTATDKPLADVLDEMFKKADLGYVYGTKKYKQYKGGLVVVKGKARGEDGSATPATTAKPPKETPDKTTTEKPPKESPADSADKDEQEAARKLKTAKEIEDDGKVEPAKERYQDIITMWPKTKAALEAKQRLEKLENPNK